MLCFLAPARFRLLGGCFLLAVASLVVHAQSLTFSTFAGPPGGPGATDGIGSAAHFFGPSAVAADKAGNVYVADGINRTIRKITPAGAVSTLAGLAGDFDGTRDGTGSVARFGAGLTITGLSGPFGVAVDGAGNVYVADTFNHTIRKITATGVVTTLAGSAHVAGGEDGTGDGAHFQYPRGVATDSAGNIYVADSQNHTIRKITPAGTVTTLAGSPGLSGTADGTGSAARFKFPFSLALDGSGSIYVADTGSHTIRKITPAGVVATVAGSPGDFGTADGIGSAARFNNPRSVAVDSAGNIYVADQTNATIRKITAAGVVTTLAGAAGVSGFLDGTGAAARFGKTTFGGPLGVACDGAGNVYVADTVNDEIRKITPAAVVSTLAGSPGGFGSVDGPAIVSRFSSPQGVATDSSGNVYVGDTFNHTIRKITPAGAVTTLAGSPGLNGSTDGAGSAARFDRPAGLAADSSGNLYVADYNNSTIRKITPAGVVTTFAGSAGKRALVDGTGSDARFSLPWGVATDGAGNVYVADYSNCSIRKITPAASVTTLAGRHEIGSEDGTGSAAGFNFPAGLAIDSAGTLYVADSGNHTIRKVTSEGVVTTLAGAAGVQGREDGTGSAAHFEFDFSGDPPGLAMDGSGNLYVADTFSGTIRKVTPAGVVTTIGTPFVYGCEEGTGHSARFRDPSGVATDRAGNVYVTDTFYSTIRVSRPALADAATIDSATGDVFIQRQLNTSPQTATSWQWSLVRQPTASTATLSSTSIRNPVFTPDVDDIYIFRLAASDGVNTSITTVQLTASRPRRRTMRR